MFAPVAAELVSFACVFGCVVRSLLGEGEPLLSLSKFIRVEVTAEKVTFFRKKAAEKIAKEKWVGRNKELKALNFVKAWTSEYSWKTQLEERGILHEWADTYVGTVEDAPLDFKMWFGGVAKSIGLRSRDVADLSHWKEVPYPDDRVRTGQTERIEDYTIAASLDFREDQSAEARLYGAIAKAKFIPILGDACRRLSPNQQEYFRLVPLSIFDYDVMISILDRADRE